MKQRAKFDRRTGRLDTAVRMLDAKSHERERLIEEYQKRSEAAYAPETLRLYRTNMRQFFKWCEEFGYDPSPPVDPVVVAEHVEYLGGKIASSTIGNRLWAIGEYHQANFCASPTKHQIVDLALKGVKRTYGTALRQSAPLCKKEVLQIVKNLGDTRLETRDKAVLLITSDSWCRASEVVALKVKDMIRQEDGSSLLYVSRSKTDRFGEGNYAYLSPLGTRAAVAWIQMVGLKQDDPLLTKHQPGASLSPLNTATISRILKRITGRNDISSHSTRIGGVHDAFRMGCDLSSIMIAGRWRSPEMPARYARRILASQSAAADICSIYDEE